MGECMIVKMRNEGMYRYKTSTGLITYKRNPLHKVGKEQPVVKKVDDLSDLFRQSLIQQRKQHAV